MAGTTKRRARRAAKRLERQRRAAITWHSQRNRGPGAGPELPPPPSWPDDLDGGAGVREPRRPFPGQPSGARALELDDQEFGSLVSLGR